MGWLAVLTAMLTVAGSVATGTAAIAPPNQAAGVASIQPADGTVVGVAHPVIVTFTAPVTNRPAAERAIKITASYAVRVTWSGVYVHSAPWSVDSQGYANVSHGCINLSPDNAAWYFDTVHIGDPINVVA